jgi:ceramide glucosyltransferase
VDQEDPTLPLLEKLARDFPQRRIRLLFGSGRDAVNDKVARLTRLVAEAQHDFFVITDSDVRVQPDYLRTVISPFRDPHVGAATCLYSATEEKNLTERLQSIGMISDFFAGVMVAWQLDGITFTFGQTIVTTRQAIAGYGGYQTIEDRPADDVYAGRLVAEQGLEVKLLPYVVHSVADFDSFREFLYKRLRWMTVMRLMRPWGHLGLIFTWGLPWSLVAIAVHPSVTVAAAYLGAYLLLRIIMAWLIGIWGMKQPRVWKKMPLIPLWDAMAFAIWLASFGRRTIRWRGINYYLREGKLTAATPRNAPSVPR